MKNAITLNDSYINVRRSAAQLLCLVLLLSVCMMAVPATYCSNPNAGTDTGTIGNIFVDMFTSMSNEIYKTMRAIALPIVACFVTYGGFCAVTGGARGVEKCVDILKKCFIAVCIVAFAPLAVDQVGKWVSGQYSGDLGSYNPLA